MPNHITNILTVSGDEKRRAQLFEAIKTEKYGRGSIDFAKIIAVPENIYQGALGKKEFALYSKNNRYDWNENTNEYEYHIDENGMDMM